MARIAVVDDDLAMELLTEGLRNRGHDARRIGSASDALRHLEELATSDLVILDIIMPWPDERDQTELSSNRTAGMEIYRELRSRSEGLPLIVYSATQDAGALGVFADDPHTSFTSKWNSPSLQDLIHRIQQTLGAPESPVPPTPFIVHGHNEVAKLALKNYLQNTLHLPEPIILHEQPNLGRTIIEKFEDYAVRSSLVFVLLTPDDIVAEPGAADDAKRRARQNVIFEMGYFLGTLGRRSGRVLLLYKPPVEIPSDIDGLIYIDISHGIDAAGERIRREVHGVRS